MNYLRLEKAYSPHTATSYGNDQREFGAYLANTENVLELKDADADLVRGWAMHLMAMGRSATTVNRKLSSLRTFYKYLLNKEVIAVSPLQSVRGPKRKRPLPQFVREVLPDRASEFTAVSKYVLCYEKTEYMNSFKYWYEN